MYYLPVKFNNMAVNGLLDTGSVITVVSQNFLAKNGIKISDNLPKRKMITANGGVEEVLEMNANISISWDFNLIGPVIISKASDYELLLGLDVIDSVKGFIDPNTL